MKKSIQILCSFILALAFGVLLVGCDYVDLGTGATVRLTVTSQTQTEYEVASSFGEVSGGNGEYVITVPEKRDFLITVSAPEYETCTIPVTVKDIATGSCEKTAAFGETLRREVNIEIYGAGENIAGTCAGKALETKTDSRLTGLFTSDELKQGIEITADGAEPYHLSLTDAQCKQAYLFSSVYLVEKGYRLIRVNQLGSFYAEDSGGNVYTPYDRLETDRGWTSMLAIPLSYRGELRIVEANRAIYSVNIAAGGAYDASNEFTFYSFEQGEEYQTAIDCTENEDLSMNYTVYLQTNARIFQSWFNYGSWENNCYTFSFEPEEGETLQAILLRSRTDDNAQWLRATWKDGLTRDDFSAFAGVEAERGYLWDEQFEMIYHPETLFVQTSDPYYGTITTEVDVAQDGSFPLADTADDTFNNYYVMSEYVIYVYSDESNYRYLGGQWCEQYRFSAPCSYRLVLTDAAGNALKNATASVNGNAATEANGGYELSDLWQFPAAVTARKDGKVWSGAVIQQPSVKSGWTPDPVHRVWTATVRMIPRLNFPINLQYDYEASYFTEFTFTATYNVGGKTMTAEARRLSTYGYNDWLLPLGEVDLSTEITLTIRYAGLRDVGGSTQREYIRTFTVENLLSPPQGEEPYPIYRNGYWMSIDLSIFS